MVVLRFASHCIAIALLIGSIAGDGGEGKGETVKEAQKEVL